MDIEGFVRKRIDDYTYEDLTALLASRIREYKDVDEEYSKLMAQSVIEEVNNTLEIEHSNDEFLKKYMAGMVAGSKGNNEEVLSNYEEIIRTYPDPLMIKVVYNIYYKKVKMDKKYMDKYLYYAEMLYKEKNGKYKQLVEDNLKELGIK